MENNNIFLEFQKIKYNLFKEQNVETGLFDVTFEVEGKLLYAHKNMLNLVSPTFASMLSDRWAPNKDEPIKIKDYSYDDFYQFITFLYSQPCQLTDSNIYSMVDMAEFYGVVLFRTYCDEYLRALEITTGNLLKLMDTAEKYSLIQLKASLKTFLSKSFAVICTSDEFLNYNKSVLEEILGAAKDKTEPEDLFEAVYKWSEKQAMEKQAVDPNLKLNDTIKTEITDFLPHICFKNMKLKFLHEFVVPRGFIFSNLNELSKILSDCRSVMPSHTRVKITNSNGQALYGSLICDKEIMETIKSLNLSTDSFANGCNQIWWRKKCNLPTTPSPLKKREGVQWYLVRFGDGDIGVTPSSVLPERYYLLAELTSFTDGFQVAFGCKIEIE